MMYRYMYSVLIIYSYVCHVFMKWDINITCISVKERVNHKTTIKRITKQIQLTELNNSPKSKQNHFTEPNTYKCWIDWLMAFTMAAEYPTVSASVS